MKGASIVVRFWLEGDLASLVRPPASSRARARLEGAAPAAHGPRDEGVSTLRAEGRPIERALEPTASVKDAIERLGIPHTEVLGIEVNGRFVGFGRRLAAGDEVRVFSQSAVVPRGARLGPSYEGWEPRFVLDVHLGTLARRLRLLGFDSVYDRRLGDPELARLAHSEDRALLTRDRGLLERNEVERGHLVRSTVPRLQLQEGLTRFDLRARFAPFTRCIRCNAPIEPTESAAVADRLAPGVLRDFDELFRCSGCGQPYWRGSHYERLVALVESLRGAE